MAPRVWTFLLLELASAVALVASAVHPLTARAPVRLDVISAAILAATGAVTALRWRRVTDTELLIQAAGGLAITVALAAGAASGGGALLSSAGFIWIALWVALFFTPSWLVAFLGAEAVGVPLAAAASAHPLQALAAAGSMVGVAAPSSAVLAGVVGGLRRIAVSDQLTGLLNRHGLDLALDRLQGRRRAGRPTSLVAIDLDGLKSVNDQGGHSAGDRLLADFAAELAVAVRRSDIAARTGGDEFLVILADTNAGGAHIWAQRLKGSGRTAWSFGVAERRPGEPFPAWLERADRDLYDAKRSSEPTTPASASGGRSQDTRLRPATTPNG